jgi:anaerobic selenocysteine-containing dehydrogenase
VDDTPWEQIVAQSGLTLVEIEQAARMYAKGKNVIMCWAMGITQHRHSVPTIQEIANLMLLRGNIGKPAPACARCAATATCRATAPWASTSAHRWRSSTPGAAFPVQGAA